MTEEAAATATPMEAEAAAPAPAAAAEAAPAAAEAAAAAPMDADPPAAGGAGAEKASEDAPSAAPDANGKPAAEKKDDEGSKKSFPKCQLRLRLDSGCYLARTIKEDKGEGEKEKDDGNVDDATKAKSAAADDALLLQEQAAERGWLTDEHAQALEKKLIEAASRLGNAAPPLWSLRSERDAAAARNRGYRPQLTNGITLKGAGSGGFGRSSSGYGAASAASSSWHARATDVLAKTRQALGVNAWIFDLPVDASKVPDYYTVVKNPMDLSTIARRLLASPAAPGGGGGGGEAQEKGAYVSPDQFMADMRLVWSNCALYNGRDTSEVGRLGSRIEQHFERCASACGLGGGSRAKRATAGVAAPKYEPPAISAEGGGGGGGARPATSGRSGGSRGGHQQPPVPSSSGGGGAPPPAYLALQAHQRLQREQREQAAAAERERKAAASQAARPSPRQPPPPPAFSDGAGAAATTTPRSTTSAGGGRARSGGQREMSYERMSAIGEALGGLDGAALEGALDIVRHALGDDGDGDGEVELDFDAIGPEALWRLDAYLVGLGLDTAPRGEGEGGGGGGGASGGVSGGGGGGGGESSDSDSG